MLGQSKGCLDWLQQKSFRLEKSFDDVSFSNMICILMQYNGYFTAKEGVLHSSCKLNEMLHNAVDSY